MSNEQLQTAAQASTPVQASPAPVQRRKAATGGDYSSQSAALEPGNQPGFEAQAAALTPVQMEEKPGAQATAAPQASDQAGQADQAGAQASPSQEGASTEGAPAAEKPRGPVWVPFDIHGAWDSQEVLAQLSALCSVPAPLKAAILAGPKAAASYCVTLRDAADKVTGDDNKTKAAKDASNSLSYCVKELALGTRQSPLQYSDLARVATWSVQYGGATVDDAPAPVIDLEAPKKAAQDAENAAALGKPDEAMTAGQRYRAAVLKSLQAWEGVTEGAADGRFYQFCSKTSLESARKAAGLKGNTVTTCISFLGQVQSDAMRETGLQPSADFGDNGAYWYLKAIRKTAGVPEGAFHPATAGMTDRPKPGDIIYLTFSKDVPGTNLKAGMFSHVGYLSSRADAAAPGDRERWTTTDGGQGSATKYDPTGQMIQKGAEKIASAERWYDPATRLIYGSKEAGQGGDGRYLMGWTDIEALFPAPPPVK